MKARWATPLAAIAALALAACSSGGSSSTTSSATSAAAGSPTLAAALARVQAAQVEPHAVGVTVPLSKVPAKGKTIAYMECGVGICKQIGSELDKAAAVLGWKIDHVDLGTTPEQIVAAWDRTLATTPKVDGIITGGVPVVVFQRELTAAKAAGIPVVDNSSANAPGTAGIIADITPVEDNQARGKLMADWAATQTGGKTKSVFLDIPDYPTLLAEQKAFSAQLAADCTGCTTDVINFSATDIGTNVPAKVVSYLQTHTNINYIALSFDDVGIGLAQALKAAGLTKVGIVGQAGSQTAAADIKNGNLQTATISQGVGQMSYKFLDIFARTFNGESIAPDKANLLPLYLQTKATIGDPNDLWKGSNGYAAEFTKLWQPAS